MLMEAGRECTEKYLFFCFFFYWICRSRHKRLSSPRWWFGFGMNVAFGRLLDKLKILQCCVRHFVITSYLLIAPTAAKESSHRAGFQAVNISWMTPLRKWLDIWFCAASDVFVLCCHHLKQLWVKQTGIRVMHCTNLLFPWEKTVPEKCSQTKVFKGAFDLPLKSTRILMPQA